MTAPDSWFRKFLNWLKVALIFTVAVALSTALLFWLDSNFRVKKIEIEGAETGTAVIGLEEFYGNGMFFFDTRDASSKLKSDNPFIDKVDIKKIYPSKLNIFITFYGNAAQLEAGGGYFVLGSDSRILSKSKKKATGLPLITYYQKLSYYSYNAGDYPGSDDIKAAVYFILSVENLGIRVDSLDIKDKNMLVCNLTGRSIVFTVERKKEDQIYEAAQIIRQFKIEGRDYKVIDLRFDKPIVKF